MTNSPIKTATLAGGCFWCYEPIFRMFKGVEDVQVGYATRTLVNPTYEEVSTGSTDVAEAFQVRYNPVNELRISNRNMGWH